MLTASNEFKVEFKKYGRQLDTYITCDNITINSDKLKSISYGYNSNFLKSIMRKVVIEYDETIDLKDKIINVYSGVKVGNIYQYIDLGKFVQYEAVQDNIERHSKTSTFYDYMVYSMIPYDLELTYPCTLLQFVQAICNRLNIELVTTSFVNFDLIINEDLYTVLKASYRDVLDQVAQTTGSCIFISNNKLVIKQPTETGEIIDEHDCEKMTINSKYGPINSLVLSRIVASDGSTTEDVYKDDPDSITVNGLTELKIAKNELMDKNRETYIVPLFNSLNGLYYYPFTLSHFGFLYFEPCDIVTLKNLSGVEHKAVIFNCSETITTGIKGTLVADIPSVTNTKYQFASSIEKRQLLTEITVNKQQGTITSIVSEQAEQSSKLVQQQLDLNGVNINLQQAGGLNLIQDSTLRLGLAANIKTGTVEVVQNKDTIDNTISDSAISINNGSVQFKRINIIAEQDYTFSCRIYKVAGVNASIEIVSDKTYTTNITGVNEQFFEVEVPINSTLNYVDIYLKSDNNYALFSDCMFNKGAKLSYQPYQGEILSNNYKFGYDGFEIESSATKSKLVAKSSAIQIVNTETNKVKADFNGENTTMDRVTVQERINIGPLRYTVMQNGHVMATFDEEDG